MEFLISGVSALVGAGASYGLLKGRVDALDRQINNDVLGRRAFVEVKDTVTRMDERIHTILETLAALPCHANKNNCNK